MRMKDVLGCGILFFFEDGLAGEKEGEKEKSEKRGREIPDMMPAELLATQCASSHVEGSFLLRRGCLLT